MAAAALLYNAHLNNGTGLLSIESGGHVTRVYVQGGKVVEVEDLLGLLDGVPVAGLTGNLMSDMGRAMAAGQPLDHVRDTAARNLGCTLALVDGDQAVSVSWQDDAPIPAGCFPLGVPIPALLRRGFQAERSPASAHARWKPQITDSFRLSGVRAEGLGTRASRLLSDAKRGGKLKDLMFGYPPDDAAWSALDLLLSMGVLSLEEDADRKARRARVIAKARKLEARAREYAAMHPADALRIEAKESMAWLNEEAIRGAFRAIAVPYHPDQNANRPGPVRKAAALVFHVLCDRRDALVNDAALLDEEKERLEWRAKDRKWVPRADRKRARDLFRKAQGLEQLKRWDEALDVIREARDIDPNAVLVQVYEAFYAGITKQTDLLAAVQKIDALDLSESVGARVEATYRAGWLLRMAGKKNDALARFATVLQASPDHLGAQRESRMLKRKQSK